ncbi:MAG: LexA family protein [Chlorobiota bacterium]|jgi:DNA polymerase V
MSNFEIIGFLPKSDRKIPFFTMSVAAGIPIPVEGDVDREVDLNDFLVERPAATFFVKVKGDMLKDVGISDNDILIIDTSIEPTDGKFVIASVNDELAVRFYREIEGERFLESHTGQFLSLDNDKALIEFQLLGTVTKVIHSL